MRNFKRCCWLVLFFILVIGANEVLNYTLIPSRHMRVDMHNLSTGKYEDLYLGTSHGFAAFHTKTLEDVTKRKSYNMARGGVYPRDGYYLLKYAASKHKPKRVVYEFDPSYFINPDGLNNNYNVVIDEMPFGKVKVEYFLNKLFDKDFRVSLFPWFYYRKDFSRMKDNIKQKQSENYKNFGIETFRDPLQQFEEGGHMFINRNEGANKDKNPLIFWENKSLQKDSQKYFLKLVDYCKKNQIELVVVTTPVPKETLDKKPKSFENAHKYMKKLAEKHGFPYIDFNQIPIKEFDNSVTNYDDYDGHMYGDSAILFSGVMWDYINREIKK